MKQTLTTLFTTIVFLCSTSATAVDRQDFSFDRIMSDLESELNLTNEKLKELEPALESKALELNNHINDTVEEGYFQMNALSDKLDAASRKVEDDLRSALSSEEIQKLENYLNSIDEAAIKEINDELVNHLVALLELTEDQINKLVPVIEQAFNQLSEMIEQVVKEGSRSLEEFKTRYTELNETSNQKLNAVLSDEQLQKYQAHRSELGGKIESSLGLN